jgi:hypothetical protein
MSTERVTERSPLQWRGLTSFIMTLAFLVLATTGVVLYVSPQGRVANWTGWSVLGLHKEQVAAVHYSASLLLVIASAFHLYFNWQVLVRYLVLQRRVHLKRELIGAIVLVTIIIAGTILEIPPFSSISSLNDRIKVHWENRSSQAPYPHAEASTLADFSRRTGMSLTVLKERLTQSGIITAVDPESQTLADLAEAHGFTPGELFIRISAAPPGSAAGHGSGLGRRTLRSICESHGIPVNEALDILQQNGLTAEADSTLKSLAEQKGITPAEVRDMLVEKNE